MAEDGDSKERKKMMLELQSEEGEVPSYSTKVQEERKKRLRKARRDEVKTYEGTRLELE